MWHSLCLVVEPVRWAVWVNGEAQTRSGSLTPLPLSGILVLGQDQDQLDGGYSIEQSFLGQVTGLTLWQTALTSNQLREWASCNLPDLTPVLLWNTTGWKLRNDTGAIQSYPEGPCISSNVIQDNLLLFTSRKLPEEAYRYLLRFKLQLVIPKNDEEVEKISALLKENANHCPIAVKGGYGTWLGLKKDVPSGRFTDYKGHAVETTLADYRVKISHNMSYVIQNSDGEWLIMSGHSRQCFTARQRGKAAVFKLHGLSLKIYEIIGSEDLSFVMASDPGNGVYFHGYRQLNIKKEINSSRWCLSSLHFQQLACVTSLTLPVGRLKWRLYNPQERAGSSTLMPLSLSTCSEKEYSCSDASCVDLQMMCNFEFDCPDKSDETGCATALVPPQYLHTYPPDVPLPIYVEVIVEKLANFDMLGMSFYANLNVKLVWRDSMLTFAHLGLMKSREVVTEEGKQVWQPMLVVQNSPGDDITSSILEVEKQGYGMPTKNGYMYAGAENPLIEKVTIKSTVHCQYQLQWYPWDEQHCIIELQVSNVGEKGLLVNESSLVSECPTILEDYRVKYCNLTFDAELTNTLWLRLRLARRYEYHLWTTFLPTSLLVVLGYGTLLLPVELFNERGTMSLTTLLVFISLYTETSNSLPSTAYLKHIDLWFVFSLTYLSLIICVHLATFPTRQHIDPLAPRQHYWTPSSSSSPSSCLCTRQPTKPTSIKHMPSSAERNLRTSRLILAPVFLIFMAFYCLILLK